MKKLRRFSFVSNFNKLTFARLFSLNFSNKSPWCSPVQLKFESYNLQHCKKNCRKLVSCVFTDKLLYYIIFGWLYCHEVFLVKNCNKPLLQKSETKIFDQKRFIKTCWKSTRKNNSGVLRKSHIMPKLLTLSKRSQLNCWQIQQLFAFLPYILNMLSISHGRSWKLLKMF